MTNYVYRFGGQTRKLVEEGPVSYHWIDGKQITASETHPEWRSFRKNGRFLGDIGGDFYSLKQYVEGSHPIVGLEGEKGDYNWLDRAEYQGPFLPLSPPEMKYPKPRASEDDTLDELGATAISRCSPTNPTIDLTTTVGELIKEGIPDLVGKTFFKKGISRSERRKAVGKEYLNVQFGYKPLADDLAKTANRIVSGDAAFKQYLRDAGKLVRRRYEFPIEESQSFEEISSNASPWIQPSVTTLYDWSRPGGRVVLQTQRYRRRWFSGAFTYVVPGPKATGTDAMARSVIMAKKTLGIRLTPAAIWNLTPWSWAIDWFTNASDVLENLDAWIIDGQVLRYGYMMEHTIDKHTYHFLPGTGGAGRPHQLQSTKIPPSVTLVTETKLRRTATPYGFGLTWDGLSVFQKSILTALGISKVGGNSSKRPT